MTRKEEHPERAALSPEKAALLDRWLRGRNSAAATASRAGIPRRRDAAPAPLSFAQGRLWFLQQIEPEGTAYNMFSNRRLRGPLEPTALAEALTQVLRRHEALRTTFALGPDGAAHQVVSPPRPVALPLADLTGIPDTDAREAEARRLADEEAERPFDLARDVMLRARLLRLAPEDHVLLLTVHHVAYDDWSERVLLQEIAACYEAATLGRPPPLPDLPIQYADYASWQRSEQACGRFREGVDRWRSRLAGVRGLDLPTDRPRPAARREEGRHHAFTLPRELSDRIAPFARQEGATLFMTLLAAYEAFLHRWTGQTDLAVGTPIAGRSEPETQGLIGFFVNTLVIRNPVPSDVSFKELLQRVKGACAAAYGDGDVPFDVLVKELQPQRDPSRTPLVQTIFLLQQEPLPAPAFGAARSEVFPVTVRTSKFDLTLLLRQGPDGFEGIIEYDAALFDESTIGRAAEGFVAVLQHVLNNPDATLHTAPAPRPKPHAVASTAPTQPRTAPAPTPGRSAIPRLSRDAYRLPAPAAPAPAPAPPPPSPPRNDP